MPAPDDSTNNNYFIDPELMPEMVRLNKQARLLNQHMDRLFPQEPTPLQFHDVLDIACGPGGWVLELAEQYPHMQVTGIDISERMIEYATAQAEENGLENAQFRVMNALDPFDFPDASFDLVNARLIIGFMPRTAWPALIAECSRVTKPGGLLQLTETDVVSISGPSTVFHTTTDFITRALWLTGQSFCAEGPTFGITPMLRSFLQDGGYRAIKHRAYAIDYSYGTDAHEEVARDFLSSLRLLQPFLIKSGLVTAKRLEALSQQAQQEILSENFHALWYFLSISGVRPESILSK